MVQVVGLVIGIVVPIVIGSLVAYCLWLKQRVAKEPSWSVRTNNLVTDWIEALPGLSIRYNEEPVMSLSVSRVVFWNAGRGAIRHGDIAKEDKLRIEAFDGARILSVSPVECNARAAKVSADLEPDQTTAILQFDFLNHQEGAVFDVVHTGTGLDNVRVVGTVADTGQPKRRDIRAPRSEGFSAFVMRTHLKLAVILGKALTLFTYASLCICALAAAIALLVFTPERTPEGKLTINAIWIVLSYLLLLLSAGFIGMFLGAMSLDIPPKGLFSFLDAIPHERREANQAAAP